MLKKLIEERDGEGESSSVNVYEDEKQEDEQSLLTNTFQDGMIGSVDFRGTVESIDHHPHMPNRKLTSAEQLLEVPQLDTTFAKV